MLSRGASGTHASAFRLLGDDAEWSRRCAFQDSGAGKRDGAARRGGRGPSGCAAGCTRERNPGDGRSAQNNLGSALLTWGDGRVGR